MSQARSYRSRIDSLAQYRRSLIRPSIRPSSRISIKYLATRPHTRSRLARAPTYSAYYVKRAVATRSANFLTEIETSPAFSRIFQQVWPRALMRGCARVYFSRCTKFAISCHLPPSLLLLLLLPPDSVINGVSLINESRARFAHTGRAKSTAFADRPRPECPFSFLHTRSTNLYYFAALITRDTRVCLSLVVFILPSDDRYREPFTKKERRYAQRYIYIRDSETRLDFPISRKLPRNCKFHDNLITIESSLQFLGLKSFAIFFFFFSLF